MLGIIRFSYHDYWNANTKTFQFIDILKCK
jgi:hypothetical protein